MALAISFAFLLLFPVVAQSENVEFVFNGFSGREENLTTSGASIIKPTGLLRLTNSSKNVISHAFYENPIQIISRDSSLYPSASSFSTSFVFAIVPPGSGEGGYGFAFTLSPDRQFPGAQAEHYLGILNPSNEGKFSNHLFAVEFDTVKGYEEVSDSEGSHVGININSVSSVTNKPAAYFPEGSETHEDEVKLGSGDPIQAWIEYDGVNKFVNVTIAPTPKEKTLPLISHPIDLSGILKETMYIGFSASTGNKASSHYILGWSFSMNGAAPPLNLSQLPSPPAKEKSASSFKPTVIAVIATLSAFTLILLGTLFSLTLYKMLGHNESLEEWEMDCPRRFRYRDLYAATKGFKESEVIGAGGFGEVYRGTLPATGSEVAVKKIVRNSAHGMREFAPEIESLGRLRHKNLVNLQGWCKRKNDLLIVYDYISNGSLDSLIYKPKPNLST